jgi:hypothetical protein
VKSIAEFSAPHDARRRLAALTAVCRRRLENKLAHAQPEESR